MTAANVTQTAVCSIPCTCSYFRHQQMPLNKDTNVPARHSRGDKKLTLVVLFNWSQHCLLMYNHHYMQINAVTSCYSDLKSNIISEFKQSFLQTNARLPESVSFVKSLFKSNVPKVQVSPLWHCPCLPFTKEEKNNFHFHKRKVYKHRE